MYKESHRRQSEDNYSIQTQTGSAYYPSCNCSITTSLSEVDSLSHFQQSMANSKSNIFLATSSSSTTTGAVKSGTGNLKKNCLCDIFKPLAVLCQLFGILPISCDRATHKISHKWKSIPSILNIYFIISHFFGAFYWYPKLITFLRSKVEGTDLYVTIVAFSVQVLSSNIVFIVGKSSAKDFAKVWDKLHETIDVLAAKNLKCMKGLAYFVPIYLAQEIIFVSLLMFCTIYENNWSIDDDLTELEASASRFSSNFVPNITCLTFALLCFIIAKNFADINRQLDELKMDHLTPNKIGATEENDSTVQCKLARLRRLHENLCESVRSLESIFGVQLVAVFSATGISFVIGVYSLLVSTEYAETKTRQELMLEIISNGLTPMYSGMRILLVIFSCQGLMNNADETGNILNGYNIDNMSERTKHEVQAFLDKVGMFPIRVNAQGIFQLGNSFIAGAVGSIITYVLVLMQFRMDQGPGVNGTDAGNTTGAQIS